VELDSAGLAVRPPERFISSSMIDFAGAWSPDGKWIAFGSERSGTQEIWVCEASGANAQRITFLDSSW
jgi:TolB protein